MTFFCFVFVLCISSVYFVKFSYSSSFFKKFYDNDIFYHYHACLTENTKDMILVWTIIFVILNVFKFTWLKIKQLFLTFPACFWISVIFSNLKSNCANLLNLRNFQKQVKKAFCYRKLFWPCTVWINCSIDLKIFENSRPSVSNFKSFSPSLEYFFSLRMSDQFW